MMNELLTMQMLGGFFQSEWATILAVLGMGIVYLLVPVMGYDPGRRKLLLAALWAMLIKVGMGVLRTSLIMLPMFGLSPATGFSRPGGPDDIERTFTVLLLLGESVAFLGSLMLFVFGLQKLRRRELMYRPPTKEE
jgi:hypothetical protein